MDTINPGAPGDVLELGATAIAANIFQGKVSERAVYRMAVPGSGWPIWRCQNKLAAWHSAMRAEMARRARLAAGHTNTEAA